MAIRKVGVLGAGLMGSGIAEVCAKSGYDTVVREVTDELAKKGLSRIEGSLGKAVEQGQARRRRPRRGAAADRRRPTRLEDLADCDLIIEAIVENLDVKKETFGRLDAALQARDDLLLEHLLADDHGDVRRDEAAGPLRRAPLLQPGAGHEARRGRAHDRDLRRDRSTRSSSFAKSLGKEPIRTHDNSGFIVNRLLVPVPARRGARARGGRRVPGGHRQGHGARLRASHGTVQAARLRRASTRPTRSPRSCSTSTARSASRRRRS